MDRVLAELRADPRLGHYVDPGLSCPVPYRGAAEVRLIILGQDPTVDDLERRRRITTVLNLDKPGDPLARYVDATARALGASRDVGIYATNVVKNFFTARPTTLPPTVLADAASAWRPLLDRELLAHPDVPVVTLGEPILRLIASRDDLRQLKVLWGYERPGAPGNPSRFRLLQPNENVLGRLVIPLPHQPTMRGEFYRDTQATYLRFAHAAIA